MREAERALDRLREELTTRADELDRQAASTYTAGQAKLAESLAADSLNAETANERGRRLAAQRDATKKAAEQLRAWTDVDDPDEVGGFKRLPLHRYAKTPRWTESIWEGSTLNYASLIAAGSLSVAAVVVLLYLYRWQPEITVEAQLDAAQRTLLHVRVENTSAYPAELKFRTTAEPLDRDERTIHLGVYVSTDERRDFYPLHMHPGAWQHLRARLRNEPVTPLPPGVSHRYTLDLGRLTPLPDPSARYEFRATGEHGNAIYKKPVRLPTPKPTGPVIGVDR